MQNKATKLLDAASVLMAEKGYYGFSMKELAQHANVASGTTYLHFKNKEDLIQKLHQRNAYTLATYMFEGLDENATVYQQFDRIWRNFWTYCLDHPEAIISKSQFDYLPAITRRTEELLAKDLFSKVGVMLDAGVKQGIFKDLPIDVLGTLSIETCANMARKHIVGLINVNDEILEEVIASCWNAIAKKSETIE
jgi:TetR/AcrR family transcriptional repressor of multidrug resistance operon